MFKNKNKITKISNGVLIVLFVMSLISSISLVANLITGNITTTESYSSNDYLNDTILMIVYVISSGSALLILNKKIDIYKDEYPMSRQIFNLFLVLSMLSVVIMTSQVIISYFVYKEFSLYSLLSIIFGYIPVYLYALYYVNKGVILSTNNSKKENIINFFVIYLLMTYGVNVVILMLQLILKQGDVITIIQNLIISFIWMLVVLFAYQLMNNKKVKDEEEVTLIKDKEEVKIDKKVKENKKHK